MRVCIATESIGTRMQLRVRACVHDWLRMRA
jgi:hypothetical protein